MILLSFLSASSNLENKLIKEMNFFEGKDSILQILLFNIYLIILESLRHSLLALIAEILQYVTLFSGKNIRIQIILTKALCLVQKCSQKDEDKCRI